MMSQPLVATSRLVAKYVVSGLTHTLRMYMAYNDVLGQHQMVDRDGITTVLWTLGGQYVWDKIRAMLDATLVPNPATLELQQRSGTLWNPIDFAALTGAGSGGGFSPALQQTWVLRDIAFKKIRFEVLEGVYQYNYHSNTGVGLNAAETAVTSMLSGADASANAPYRWMKSRGDRFILASGAIAGLTHDLNDKLKRARGIE
jgi:hypothetical protein